MWTDHFTHAQHERPPALTPAAAILARRHAAASGWGDLRALRVELASTTERERAGDRRRRAAASAGGTILILAAFALLATSILATTRSGERLLASAHLAVAPGMSSEAASRLLIVATALVTVTVSTWLMLAVLKPARRGARKHARRPRPASRVQRHRGAIVLAAGVTPVLLGGGLPFAAKFLPLGVQIDTNSAVGSNVLDLVIGIAVPAVVLSVLYFRWVARLAALPAEASHD